MTCAEGDPLQRYDTGMGFDPSMVTPADFEELAVAAVRRDTAGLDETAMRAGFNLVRAANSLVQAAERKVHRPAGWSWPGFRVLFIVWICGEVEARNISRLAGVTRQTTSSVLTTLERAGFIERERCSVEDRRLVAVRLTQQGLEQVQPTFARHNRLESQWFACLTGEEQRLLAGLLARVLSHGGEPRPDDTPHDGGSAPAPADIG
ncbi:MarR family winged helix-turn-helix transcriptional regulator [Qaidamihabitans albus]|uniref:MarR family winged helix-turn-helix transcriptional regulator n=1 Tax=Qaidamihabitans albus TaxID=2795733 RepID=UPI0018F1A179|nr:MarR family transcriptional regulator [Qaidamihabitans albus]